MLAITANSIWQYLELPLDFQPISCREQVSNALYLEYLYAGGLKPLRASIYKKRTKPR